LFLPEIYRPPLEWVGRLSTPRIAAMRDLP